MDPESNSFCGKDAVKDFEMERLSSIMVNTKCSQKHAGKGKGTSTQRRKC